MLGCRGWNIVNAGEGGSMMDATVYCMLHENANGNTVHGVKG